MTRTGRIGLLGGTFDPFHHGHLAAALAADAALDLDAVHLIPAHIPPHRTLQPSASPEHRFAMVALGIAETPGLLVDDRELHAEGPSYTSRTLAAYAAQGWQASQMFFITGADAFAEIATWHDYPAILTRAHFVVVSRPGRDAASLRDELPSLAASDACGRCVDAAEAQRTRRNPPSGWCMRRRRRCRRRPSAWPRPATAPSRA